MAYNHEEHTIQKGIVNVLTYGLPKDAAFWAVPNGGTRKTITTKGGKTISLEGMRLKAEGVKSGVSDLMILWRGRLICLEVKTEKGRQSRNQKDWEEEITQAGGLYKVVRSVDDVRSFLTMVIPTFKARLGMNESDEPNDIDDFFTGRGTL